MCRIFERDIMKHLLFVKVLLTFFIAFNVWSSNAENIDQENKRINRPIMDSQSEDERQNFEELIFKTGQLRISYQHLDMSQVQKTYDEIEDMAKRGNPGDEQALQYLLELNSVIVSQRNNPKYNMMNDELVAEILLEFKQSRNYKAISRYAHLLNALGYGKFANLFKREIHDD